MIEVMILFTLRFLTPYLNDFDGWAIFADGDMICQGDLKELIGMADPKKLFGG